MGTTKNFDFNINEKLNNYKSNYSNAKNWFEENIDKIKKLFENKSLRDYVFEPFKDVFNLKANTIDSDIYSVITQVAIVNAVLAGLPGQMGVGVSVSMALEAWMAYAIAKHVGIEIKNPSDIFKYFGLLSSVVLTIMFGIKHVISFLFSIFSVIPFINPLIVAELLMTNLIGILFWIGFEEVKKKDSFSIPLRAFTKIASRLKEITFYQFEVLKNTLTIENMKLVLNRLKQWFNGDIVADIKILNGEMFASVAMAYLLAGEYEKLQGPLGQAFLQAIRLRWSSQLENDASIEEIVEKFKEYDDGQLQGAINTIKGKMFEIMVTNAENSDNDEWIAKMHDDESYPGSDIIFTNTQTGQTLEVSLKATGSENTEIIEYALDKYSDIPIMTTEEAASKYLNDDRVFGSGISNEKLEEIIEENMDRLLNSINQVDTTHVVTGGVTVGTLAAIWPFTVAYMRKKISYQSFEKALQKILGDSGIKLASRLSYAVLFGPTFAWYLLARGVSLAVNKATDINNIKIVIVKY